MGKVIVSGFSLSLDGYGAGPDQTLEDPLGKRGLELHEWMFRSGRPDELPNADASSKQIDRDYATRSMQGFGAFIMGRNMFGPIRGDWPDASWKGWWGDNPPFYEPTFVLTHHPRESVEMEGGTVFHFVTDGIESALEQARSAAGDTNVKIGGGVSTVKQYLQAGLVDELHLVILPVVLGRGEAMFAGLDLPALGFSVTRHVASATSLHAELSR